MEDLGLGFVGLKWSHEQAKLDPYEDEQGSSSLYLHKTDVSNQW